MEKAHATWHSPVFVPSLKEDRTGIARTEQPSLGRLDKVLVIGWKRRAAHFTMLGRDRPAGKLAQYGERTIALLRPHHRFFSPDMSAARSLPASVHWPHSRLNFVTSAPGLADRS